MKYIVVNNITNEKIVCATLNKGRELAVRLSTETRYLWYLKIAAE